MDTDRVTPDLAATAPSGDAGQPRFLTGDAVHLDVRTARLGSRALARLIDIVVQIVLAYLGSFVLILLLALLGLLGIVVPDDAAFDASFIILLVVVFVGYPVLMETTTRGRTLGKLVVGLRVVRDDGGPVTFRQALTRGLVSIAIEWPGIVAPPLTWLVSIWVMIASPQGKRIGDHTAGTIVIHERTPAAWGWVPEMPAGLDGWASTLDLAGLDDDLALAVRHFLARNRQLREPARTHLGQRLAREVASVTNPPPPANTPGWAYLAAVHAERHRRSVRQLAAVRTRAATVWPDLALAVMAPGAPWYGLPGYRTPGYGTPGYGTPGYGLPGYGGPRPAAPGSDALGYGAFAYGAPSDRPAPRPVEPADQAPAGIPAPRSPHPAN